MSDLGSVPRDGALCADHASFGKADTV